MRQTWLQWELCFLFFCFCSGRTNIMTSQFSQCLLQWQSGRPNGHMKNVWPTGYAWWSRGVWHACGRAQVRSNGQMYTRGKMGIFLAELPRFLAPSVSWGVSSISYERSSPWLHIDFEIHFICMNNFLMWMGLWHSFLRASKQLHT